MSDGMRFLILTLFCMCAMLNQITGNCNLQKIICISERYEPNTTQMLVQSPVTSILFTCKNIKSSTKPKTNVLPAFESGSKKKWNYKSCNLIIKYIPVTHFLVSNVENKEET